MKEFVTGSGTFSHVARTSSTRGRPVQKLASAGYEKIVGLNSVKIELY